MFKTFLYFFFFYFWCQFYTIFFYMDFNNSFVDFIKNITVNCDLIAYFTKNNKFLQLTLKKLDNIYLLIPDKISNNLIHSDNFINFILHNFQYIIFDSTLTYIFAKKNKIYIDKSHEILCEMKKNWLNVSIYNLDIGLDTTLIYLDNTYYYVIDNDLEKTNKNIDILIEKSDFKSTFETNIFTDIVISTKNISHILYYKYNFLQDNIFLPHSNVLYYSCIDELLFDLENVSFLNEHKKKLTTAGFILNYNSVDYVINTYIFQKIKDIMPKYKNINKCYIELYKNDNLSFIISYISLYPIDIVKRINVTFKTLSREFLNIYHVTRKKANIDLYNILSNNYKTILFDLHKIFIYTRKNDEPKNSDNLTNSDEEFYEKKSLNHDITYKYIKKLGTDQICNILIERINLMEKINDIKINMNNIKLNSNDFKILFNDCICTKTMSFLLQRGPL